MIAHDQPALPSLGRFGTRTPLRLLYFCRWGWCHRGDPQHVFCAHWQCGDWQSFFEEGTSFKYGNRSFILWSLFPKRLPAIMSQRDFGPFATQIAEVISPPILYCSKSSWLSQSESSHLLQNAGVIVRIGALHFHLFICMFSCKLYLCGFIWVFDMQGVLWSYMGRHIIRLWQRDMISIEYKVHWHHPQHEELKGQIVPVWPEGDDLLWSNDPGKLGLGR